MRLVNASRPAMELRIERQLNPVADEVAAITAVVRPILFGTVRALKQQVIDDIGGLDMLLLRLLPRLRRPGDGECGICFEYAVHDAMTRRDGIVVDRIATAMSEHCRVPGSEPASILFGAEKTGSQQLIETARALLTDESALLYGSRGRPVKLKRHITNIAAAFRSDDARRALPQSISGLWKADLFLGTSDADRWVGTTVKINPEQLEWARGLRIGIVPSREGASDAVRVDEGRNLVVCPLPHDGSFMETFYKAWQVVQQFLAADARLPKEVALPRPAERQVARYLADRRDFPVLDVIEALGPLAQPELLETREQPARLVLTREAEVQTGAIVAPMPNVRKRR
jgi:hypothetical protein